MLYFWFCIATSQVILCQVRSCFWFCILLTKSVILQILHVDRSCLSYFWFSVLTDQVCHISDSMFWLIRSVIFLILCFDWSGLSYFYILTDEVTFTLEDRGERCLASENRPSGWGCRLLKPRPLAWGQVWRRQIQMKLSKPAVWFSAVGSCVCHCTLPVSVVFCLMLSWLCCMCCLTGLWRYLYRPICRTCVAVLKYKLYGRKGKRFSKSLKLLTWCFARFRFRLHFCVLIITLLCLVQDAMVTFFSSCYIVQDFSVEHTGPKNNCCGTLPAAWGHLCMQRPWDVGCANRWFSERWRLSACSLPGLWQHASTAVQQPSWGPFQDGVSLASGGWQQGSGGTVAPHTSAMSVPFMLAVGLGVHLYSWLVCAQLPLTIPCHLSLKRSG